MIAGFDSITSQLDDYEIRTVLPRIVSGLSLLKQSGKTLSSTRIIERLYKEGITLSGARLRKVINHIRINHIIRGIVADDKGYWVALKPEQILEYLDSLDSRIEAITAMRNALYEDYQEMYREQNLFSEPPASDPIPEPETKPKTQAQLKLELWMQENA